MRDLQTSQRTQRIDPQNLRNIAWFSKIINLKRELSYTIIFIVLVLVSSIVVSRLASPFDLRLVLSFGLWSSHDDSYGSKPRSEESCDYSIGTWVWDDRRPLETYDESCPFLDPGFRCQQNGRSDDGFRRWRWKPDGCDLPRFNASDLLERSRNGRIVFAGDSIGRNQWESLTCMLSQGVRNKSSIREVNGKPVSRHKGFLSMKFSGYNLTVEYYRTPFLVPIGRPPPNSSKQVVSSIKVDRLHWYSNHWVGADVLVFNDGHWWNKGKTIDMGYYFEENNTVNMTMSVMEAFGRSLQTWKIWALQNLDPQRSHIFFRSYSPVHYRNRTWNEGGNCDINVGPETNHSNIERDGPNNKIVHDIIKQMDNGNWKVQFLNITYLTGFRKDGHPSKYREPGTPLLAPQDCSHWCLPGVPDTWNELLYASLTSKRFTTQVKK